MQIWANHWMERGDASLRNVNELMERVHEEQAESNTKQSISESGLDNCA